MNWLGQAVKGQKYQVRFWVYPEDNMKPFKVYQRTDNKWTWLYVVGSSSDKSMEVFHQRYITYFQGALKSALPVQSL